MDVSLLCIYVVTFFEACNVRLQSRYTDNLSEHMFFYCTFFFQTVMSYIANDHSERFFADSSTQFRLINFTSSTSRFCSPSLPLVHEKRVYYLKAMKHIVLKDPYFYSDTPVDFFIQMS